MSRTNTQTYELRHPETGHTVYADFGSRSFSHFLSLGYSYPEANVTGTVTIEFQPKSSDFDGHSLASAPIDPTVSAVVASALKKSRAKPKAKPEAAHGDDNP